MHVCTTLHIWKSVLSYLSVLGIDNSVCQARWQEPWPAEPSHQLRVKVFFFLYIKFVTKSKVHICIDLVLRFLVLLHVAVYSGVHLSVDCEVFIVEGYSFDIVMNYT